MRKINQEGLDLIKHFEGLRLSAYPDPGTGDAPWTIGYGHTGEIEVPLPSMVTHTVNIQKGMNITSEAAVHYLTIDTDKVANNICKLLTTEELNDNQFSALVCFVFNVGIGNFKSSTLLKKLKVDDYVGAADEFLRWNKAAGRVLSGLTKRREAERALFLKP